VDEKLRRGFDIAARANGDGDALGVALLALHGALEDHLDEALRQLPDLAPEDRQALEDPAAGWVTRANLALRYGLVTREQRQAILDANRQRQEFAHGDPFVSGQRALDNYANLVAGLVGRRPTAAHPDRPAAQRPARAVAPTAATAPARTRASEGTTMSASSPWDDRVAVRRARRPDLLPDSLPVRALIAALAVLVLAVAVWRLLGWSDPAEPSQTAGGPLTPVITPAATLPPPTPTPEVRQGRIVGLGGAAGYLHDPPGFDTPTLPPPLPEGAIVVLLDDAPVDAGGATWVKVAYSGYEGWVPQNNVEAAGAAPAVTPSLVAGP
jgi:hypothetical protein